MDHDDTVRGFLVERYLLGELEETEAEAFEVHMFECPACAQEVTWRVEQSGASYQSHEAEERMLVRRFCRTFPRQRKRR